MIDVIPAIDLIDGRCVRLRQGDYAQQTTYSEDPAETAAEFARHGATRLHVVDLDGARTGSLVNVDAIRRIIERSGLSVDLGGGIQSDDSIELAFDCGARQVNCGSVAVTDPAMFERWIARYGAERIILSADVRDRTVCIAGWKRESPLSLFELLDRAAIQGITEVTCTDIRRDGTGHGPAVELYREIMSRHPRLSLIASGGVSSAGDLRLLEEAGVRSVIVGRALYEGTLPLTEAFRREE